MPKINGVHLETPSALLEKKRDYFSFYPFSVSIHMLVINYSNPIIRILEIIKCNRTLSRNHSSLPFFAFNF